MSVDEKLKPTHGKSLHFSNEPNVETYELDNFISKKESEKRKILI